VRLIAVFTDKVNSYFLLFLEADDHGLHGWTGMKNPDVECRICAIRDIRGSPDSSCLLVSIRGLIILLRDLSDEVLENLCDLGRI